MQATIKLTTREFEDLKAFTKQQKIDVALRTALREYLNYARRMQLKELSGKVKMQDNWRELESLELADDHGSSTTGAD